MTKKASAGTGHSLPPARHCPKCAAWPLTARYKPDSGELIYECLRCKTRIIEKLDEK
jgi:hypothetical protein